MDAYERLAIQVIILAVRDYVTYKQKLLTMNQEDSRYIETSKLFKDAYKFLYSEYAQLFCTFEPDYLCREAEQRYKDSCVIHLPYV